MSKNIFSSGADEIVEGIHKIHITQNTVRFGSDVYQFKNVTGFGMITIKNTVPKVAIFLFCLIGVCALITGIFSANEEISSWGAFLLFMGLLFMVNNKNPDTTYGLKIYLPSNEDKIFLSKDREGIKEIVSYLYEFMEKEH
ncbi:MAG: DUF6232 family protein, partial [Planktothrix sp.]